MLNPKIFFQSALINGVALILITGCSPKTTVRSWTTDFDYNRNFKKILVMGLANNVNIRLQLEEEITQAGRANGLTIINGMSHFPPELGRPFDDIEYIKNRLKERNFDAILTITLVDTEAARYVKPEVSYEPLVYYDRFRNYYQRTAALVYKPGYFSINSKFFLETNLYELNQGKLVWTGRSIAFETYELDNDLRKYSKRLFQKLIEEGVIQP